MEMIEVYSLGGKLLGEMERDVYYSEALDEYNKKGRISRKIKSVRVILLTSDGRIYVQQRAKGIGANAGLYDKTVGGHIPAGISDDDTAVKECAEELGIDAVVVGRGNFAGILSKVNLRKKAVLAAVSHEPRFMSLRRRGDTTFVQPYMNTTYIGYYEGHMKFMDGEVCKVVRMSPVELGMDIESHPEKYTGDIKFMLKKFRKYLVPLSAKPGRSTFSKSSSF